MLVFLEILQDWWPVLLAYIVGATPFGLLIGKMKVIDIREHGSGNIGATNVVRTLGKPVGYSVLVLDILKGIVPVLIAKFVTDLSIVHIATAIAAILGHNYTFWLKFKGGKGIATTAGAMAPILPIALIAAVLSWIVLLKVTRYVSIASIGAAIAIPVTYAICAAVKGTWDLPVLIFALVICFLAIWKHRANIKRLAAGEELRFGADKEID